MIVYKKTDEWYIERHRITTSDKELIILFKFLCNIQLLSGTAIHRCFSK